MQRSKRKAPPRNKLARMFEKLEHLKTNVRAKMGYPFHVIKNLFRHRKARSRGLVRNTAQVFALFGPPIWYWLAGDLRSAKLKVRPKCR